MTIWGFRALLGASALLAIVLMFGLGLSVRAEGPITSLPDPARGKVLAERVCTNCHLVSDRQSKAVADVPSFAAIANKPNNNKESGGTNRQNVRQRFPFLPLRCCGHVSNPSISNLFQVSPKSQAAAQSPWNIRAIRIRPRGSLQHRYTPTAALLP